MTATTGEGRRSGHRRPPAAAAIVALVGWAAFLAGALAVLHAVGGALAPPPLTRPARLAHWIEEREGAQAAFAVLRLVALGLTWYLLVTTVVATVARAAGAASMVRAADAVSLPVVRHLVSGAVGLSLAAATLAAAGGTALAEGRGGPSGGPVTSETMRRLPDVPPADAMTATASAADAVVAPGGAGSSGPTPTGPPPTMRRLPGTGAGGSGEPTATTTASGNAPTTSVSPPGAPSPPGERMWQVHPGDHFWAVAEHVLAEAWGRTPADDDVDPYWRAIVDANAAVLRDPGNPDLLFPGQVIAVPAPPAAPALPAPVSPPGP